MIVILSMFVKLQLTKYYLLLLYDKFYIQNGLNSCINHLMYLIDEYKVLFELIFFRLELKAGRNFEAVQSYLGLFLKLHGETVAEEEVRHLS